MTYKQNIFSKANKARRVKNLLDVEYVCESRRTTLASSNDAERMAVESLRAQYIRHLNTSPNEFGSYYRGTSKYIEPPYSMTSHTKRKQRPDKYPMMPKFPAIISEIHFCDVSDASTSASSRINVDHERKFRCRCGNCSKLRCPGKVSGEKKTTFKDNIMTFCDRCTMTPKLVNANCGYTESSAKIECGISPFRIRDMAVRDTDARISTPEVFSRPLTPIIRMPSSCPMAHRRSPCDVMQDKADTQCDAECGGKKLRPMRSSKPIVRIPKDFSRESSAMDLSTRVKNLYNEGISDVIASQLPAGCVDRLQYSPPFEPMPECSATCAVSDCPDNICSAETYIPYSHKHISKYHTDCKREPSPNEAQKEIGDPACSFPKSARKLCRKKSIVTCRMPESRLPRKVLASEKDIEGFMKNQCKNQCNKYKKR